MINILLGLKICRRGVRIPLNSSPGVMALVVIKFDYICSKTNQIHHSSKEYTRG